MDLSEEQRRMRMEFYQGVETDFGDRFLDIGEILRLREDDSNKDDGKKSRAGATKKKKVPTQIVCEDDVDSGDDYDYSNFLEYEEYEKSQLDYNDDITKDVLQVIGDGLMNEPLEARYRQQNNVRKDPVAKSKSKKPSSSSNSKTGSSNKILKKTELRKEMLPSESADSKVGFVEKKTKNALLNALKKPSTNDAEAEAKDAAEDDDPSIPETPEMDPVKKERIMKWLEQYSSEEEYFSAKSSSYPSASASISDYNETPKKYRATSKRSKTSTTPPTSGTNNLSPSKILASGSISSKSPTCSDEVVGFKMSSPSPKSTTGKTPSSKEATKKKVSKKSTYKPTRYISEYELNSYKDFPAIR